MSSQIFEIRKLKFDSETPTGTAFIFDDLIYKVEQIRPCTAYHPLAMCNCIHEVLCEDGRLYIFCYFHGLLDKMPDNCLYERHKDKIKCTRTPSGMLCVIRNNLQNFNLIKEILVT